MSDVYTFPALLGGCLHGRQPDSHIFSMRPVVTYCFGWNTGRKSDLTQTCSCKGRSILVFSSNSEHNSHPSLPPPPNLRLPKHFPSQHRAPPPAVKTGSSLSPAPCTHSPFIPIQQQSLSNSQTYPLLSPQPSESQTPSLFRPNLILPSPHTTHQVCPRV